MTQRKQVLAMSFYSIYLFEKLVELHLMEQEYIAIARKGRLVSTHKGYQSAWEAAITVAKKKQLPLIDHTKAKAVLS